MKQKILEVLVLFAGMLLSASFAQAAQPTITATHTIVSESTAFNGTTVTTLNRLPSKTIKQLIYNNNV